MKRSVSTSSQMVVAGATKRNTFENHQILFCISLFSARSRSSHRHQKKQKQQQQHRHQNMSTSKYVVINEFDNSLLNWILNLIFEYHFFQLNSDVKISFGAYMRLVCRLDQYVHRIRVKDSRALRLTSPASRHCTRDSARQHPQGIQHADDRDQHIRTRVLVELVGCQGSNREGCRRCDGAD